MHSGQAAQLVVYLGEKRPQMQLPSEQTACEIPDDPRLNFPRIDPRVGNRGLCRIPDDVPNGLPLFFDVPFEISPARAQDVNRLRHAEVS